ncbi:hypothetical protein BCR33DRAFT_835718 [Rhizoclosmatium globosum]|uniref:RNase H type-1 domain-containing protein n=1 Tax=Rhizoclosmatium globosum TaxID=329046 RepID=A0A1Y2BNE0_9FUNG|nr:hypothetical protein BCR33DRAFT_835718 [Rhizoclosmatium globosum]|eukprot:ORY36274.1 hypothetical protein BCR33DRAFT_835718 [Rhizoclosmatium globosum]
MTSDANDHCVGAFLQNLELTAGTKVPTLMLVTAGVSINIQEMWAFFFAICVFAEHLRDKWLDLELDSQVVHGWLENGSSSNPLPNILLVEAWKELQRINCHIASKCYIK